MKTARTENNSQHRQRAIVVVGAGRSGTSSITRGVQALGVDLGNNLRTGRGKNPTGFFEDRKLLALNKRLRRMIGIRADSVRLITDETWQLPRVRRLKHKAARIIRSSFGNAPLWGYKYGRTLRLLPFWESVFDSLNLDVSYVVAIRNPLSVGRSRAKLDSRRGRQAHSDLEWLASVVPYFSLLRKRTFVVIDYDLLMADPGGQLRRLANALNIPLSDETNHKIEEYAHGFLRADMRHSRFTLQDLDTDPAVNAIVRDAYRLLYSLANNDLVSSTSAFWDPWFSVEKQLQAMAPVLDHIDRIEKDRRRASLNPAGPLQVLPALWRKFRAM